MRTINVPCRTCNGRGNRVVPRSGELRKVRESAGLSLRAMARKLQVSPSFLHDVEHERRNVTDAVLAAYLRIAHPTSETGGDRNG